MVGTTLAAVADTEPPLSLEPAGPKPLVVVIEDDYRSSLALTMLIDDWGYACIAARCSQRSRANAWPSAASIYPRS